MKRDRAWVLLPSDVRRSMRELMGANRPAMREDKQPSLLRSSPTESSQANAPSNYEKSQAAKTCAAYASGAARVRAAERPRAAHALAPPSRWRPRDAVFGKEDQTESGTMRIIVRALGIAVGGCLVALFLYIMLALPGMLSDRDRIVALTAMQRAPAQR